MKSIVYDATEPLLDVRDETTTESGLSWETSSMHVEIWGRTLHVEASADYITTTEDIEINYCPKCGRKLGGE